MESGMVGKVGACGGRLNFVSFEEVVVWNAF